MREESTRIRNFRLDLIRKIPRLPNNRQTLAELEGRSLGSLLIVWNNWAGRLIPPRSRSIKIEPTLTSDPRWKRLARDTKLLLEKIRLGEDLLPHMSRSLLRNGYAPASSQLGPSTDRWQDKDFLLTVMGYHHLHLGHASDANGFSTRTREVLFGEVTRSTFTAIGFFDHSVFDRTQAPQKKNDERTRLWRIHDERTGLAIKPNTVYMSHPIMTSGHSLHHVRHASELSWVVREIDAKLDDIKLRVEVFPHLTHAQVSNMKLQWFMHYTDLGLLDRNAGVFYVLRYGPS